MYKAPSIGLRCLYCLAVLSAIFPYGMSSWVALTLGTAGMSRILLIPTVLFGVLGIWRIFLVARYRETLGAYVFDGALRILRVIGLIGMFIAVFYLIVRFAAPPLLRSLDQGGDVSTRGVMSYVVGVYFAMLQGLVTPGLVIFELSRLLGFERQASAQEA